MPSIDFSSIYALIHVVTQVPEDCQYESHLWVFSDPGQTPPSYLSVKQWVWALNLTGHVWNPFSPTFYLSALGQVT